MKRHGVEGLVLFRITCLQCWLQRGERRTGSWVSASAPPEGPVLLPVDQNAESAPVQNDMNCVCLRCGYLASVHDQDPIRVHDGVDAVRDGEHGAVVEGLLDGVLDQSVGFCVD